MYAADVGKRIRNVRKQLQLSQTEFARRLGIVKVSVVRYEAGRVPRTDVLDRIARATGVTTAWLLHGDTDDTRATPRPAPALPPPLQESLDILEAYLFSRGWMHLPKRHRTRFEERVKDTIMRVKHELGEYQRLLEMESRSSQRRRRNKG